MAVELGEGLLFLASVGGAGSGQMGGKGIGGGGTPLMPCGNAHGWENWEGMVEACSAVTTTAGEEVFCSYQKDLGKLEFAHCANGQCVQMSTPIICANM